MGSDEFVTTAAGVDTSDAGQMVVEIAIKDVTTDAGTVLDSKGQLVTEDGHL